MKKQPNKTKYRKAFKMPLRPTQKIVSKYLSISHGIVGLQALENGRITSQQLESMRKVLVRRLQKQGKIWIKVFPHHPVSAKAGEVRMGRGKGKVNHWVARVLKGTILVEIGGVSFNKGSQALFYGEKKLPIVTKILGPIV